jgi:hypothetical protein
VCSEGASVPQAKGEALVNRNNRTSLRANGPTLLLHMNGWPDGPGRVSSLCTVTGAAPFAG